MQSVGEVMAIGRTFAESVQKALRSMETGLTGFDDIAIPNLGQGDDSNAIRAALGRPTPDRLRFAAQALRLGVDEKELSRITGYDPWFVGEIAEIIRTEAEVKRLGLPRDAVDVIGQLPHYTTVTRYVVTPVVALVRPPFTLQLDAFEVAEAFEVPLGFLMTPAHHRRHEFELQGQRRQFLSMPWQGSDANGEPRTYFIWGATAAMLRNLYGLLRG
jgi:hypothetical protein